MNNFLLYLSNNDIPFPEIQVNIHQPTIKEISLIGEENFFSAYKCLSFSKEKLSSEDRIGLEDKSNFEIIMSIVRNSDKYDYKKSIELFLSLLFPQYSIKFTEYEIMLLDNKNFARINEQNFDAFLSILNSMFSELNSSASSEDYNPIDGKSEKIAEKLRKHKNKVAEKNGLNNKKDISILGRYVSILSVGLGKDINSLMNYTVNQLKIEFDRFTKKQSYDMFIKAKMAGAQDLDDVDNWME